MNKRDRKVRTHYRFGGRNRQCIVRGAVYREPGIHFEPVNPNNATRTVFTDSHGRASLKGEYLCARGGYPPVHIPPPLPLARPCPNYGVYYWNGIITRDDHIIRLLCISFWWRTIIIFIEREHTTDFRTLEPTYSDRQAPTVLLIGSKKFGDIGQRVGYLRCRSSSYFWGFNKVFKLKFKILIHQTSSWVRTNREFGEKENDSITPGRVG